MTKGTQKRLEEELEILKQNLNLSCNLLVRWKPNDRTKLVGEVKSNIIYVYERDCDDAIQTLRHEVLDYLISQAIEPWREVANRLIKMINENAYKRKEKVVEALTRLIAD